jgi:TldD protein
VLDLVTDLMGKAERRCAYAEARWVALDEEGLAVRNGQVDAASTSTSVGIGVRARVGGGWGFAATGDVSAAAAEAALEQALAIAEAQPAGEAVPLASVEPARGHWSSTWEVDPLALPLEDKLQLLFAAEAAMRGDTRIVRSLAMARSWRERKAFASTEGAACTQELVVAGAGIAAYATDGSELQMRSYPGAHGGGLAAYASDGTELQVRSYPLSHGGQVAAAGWEQVRALDLAAHAPRVAEEAVALLSAPACPEGVTTIVLHPEQVALQVHESIGHALELDRILLHEASYAGTSWVGVDDIGSLRYGSDLLHVTADATMPGGLGTFGWDDEGVPAGSTPLIEAGVLRGALSNRESAAMIGLDRSAGCARAEGFARQPIVRMTNVNLEPGGDGSLADLVAATDEGLYLETNRSWSIDDRRLQFQFATEVAREIRGGELGRLYRNASYAGVTPRFWGSLDAVGDRSDWRAWGLTNCGKGEPGQVMAVSHGAPPARFRGVQVGVA